MLEDDICKVEYAIAKRHSLLGQVINFEDCSILPSADCRSLGLPVPEPSDKSKPTIFYETAGVPSSINREHNLQVKYVTEVKVGITVVRFQKQRAGKNAFRGINLTCERPTTPNY